MMKMLVANRKWGVFILVILLITFGIHGASYAQVGNPTITASTRQPLTDATLDESIVVLTLSGGTYERWLGEEHAHAFKVSGIAGVTLESTFDSFNPIFDVDRVSDTKVRVKLSFNGNIDTDATLTFTLGADAIANYEGPPLTAEIPVTVTPKSVVASSPSPLTEATLNGSVVTLTLSGGTYADARSVENAVTISGIVGVAVLDSSLDNFSPDNFGLNIDAIFNLTNDIPDLISSGFVGIDRVSDTKVRVKLRFDGNIDTDATLIFTLGADAIANYEGPPLTAKIPVSARAESVEASTIFPLTRETLDGSIVTLTLSGVTYKRFIFGTKNVTVSGIAGVTIREAFGVRWASDTEMTVELESDGNISRDGALIFTVGEDLIANYSGPPLTAEIPLSLVIGTQVLVDESQRVPMYWINTKDGMLQSLTRTAVDPLGSSGLRITSLAVDAVEGKIYWAERTGDSAGTIRRVNFDGTNVEMLTTLSAVPLGIAIDTVGDKLYWTNSHKAIQSADLNGGNIRTVIQLADEITKETSETCVDVSVNVGGKLSVLWGLFEIGSNLDSSVSSCTGTETNLNMTSPTDIAVDSIGGKLYWIELSGRVRRVNLDGTNLDTLVTGLEVPGGIAVADGKVYWTEGADGTRGKIQRANLNGTNVEILTVLQGIPIGIAVDTAEGKVYWANAYGGIQRTDINGGEIENVAFVTTPGDFALGSATRATPVPSSVPGANSKLSIFPSSVASPAVGERLTLSLNIAKGENVAGYEATVRFDTTALRYVSSANGDYLSAGAFFVPPVIDGNRVKLAATSLAGESNGEGTLATLIFEVIIVKASTLALSDVLLTNSAGEAFVPTVENADITEPTGLKGDVNGDGIVNIQDLVLVASNLGKTGQNAADVNSDGVVNIQDLVLVAGALGSSAASPPLNSQPLSTLTAAEVKQWLSQAQHLPLKDAASLRGIQFLQDLLAVLTPKETALLPNYPNPFNPETWIPYHLSKDADVTLHIYAINGTLVRKLEIGHQGAGVYQTRRRAAYWDGRNNIGEKVASGVYFYTLTVGDFTATRKMLIRK